MSRGTRAAAVKRPSRRDGIFAVGDAPNAKAHIRGAMSELDEMTVKRAKHRLVRLKLLLASTSLTEQNREDVAAKIALLEAHVASGRLASGLTPDEVFQRRVVLSNNEGLLDIFSIFWFLVTPFTDKDDVLERRGYVKLYVYLQRALIDSTLVTTKALKELASDAYDCDVRVFGPLSQLAFFDYLYDTIDTWTELLDPAYYATFAWSLLDAICDTRIYPPVFRHAKAVRCCTRIENEAKMVQAYTAANKVRACLTIASDSLRRAPDVIRRLMARKKATLIDETEANAIKAMYDLMVKKGQVQGVDAAGSLIDFSASDGAEGEGEEEEEEEDEEEYQFNDGNNDAEGGSDDDDEDGYSDDYGNGYGGRGGRGRRGSGGKGARGRGGNGLLDRDKAGATSLSSKVVRMTILSQLRMRSKVELPELVRHEGRAASNRASAAATAASEAPWKGRAASNRASAAATAASEAPWKGSADKWHFQLPQGQLERLVEARALRAVPGHDASSKEGLACARLYKAMLGWCGEFFGDGWQTSAHFLRGVEALEASIARDLGKLMPELKLECRAEMIRARAEEDKVRQAAVARQLNKHMGLSLRSKFARPSKAMLEAARGASPTQRAKAPDDDGSDVSLSSAEASSLAGEGGFAAPRDVMGQLANAGVNVAALAGGGRMARVGCVEEGYFAHLERVLARRKRREEKKAKRDGERAWANSNVETWEWDELPWDVRQRLQQEQEAEQEAAAARAAGPRINHSALRQVISEQLATMRLGGSRGHSREDSRGGSRGGSRGDSRGGSGDGTRVASKEGRPSPSPSPGPGPGLGANTNANASSSRLSSAPQARRRSPETRDEKEERGREHNGQGGEGEEGDATAAATSPAHSPIRPPTQTHKQARRTRRKQRALWRVLLLVEEGLRLKASRLEGLPGAETELGASTRLSLWQAEQLARRQQSLVMPVPLPVPLPTSPVWAGVRRAEAAAAAVGEGGGPERLVLPRLAHASILEETSLASVE